MNKEFKIYYTRVIRLLKVINIKDEENNKLKKITPLELIILYNIVSK